MIDSILKNNYSIGQEISLLSGFTGKVIRIAHFGNKDIRPPYHRKGIPTVQGTGKYLSTLSIIPSEWKILYGGEVSENEVLK